ncbi:unnamed protein product [Paramecium sonneborni]|uniref:Uncharacterized protein n=1 Tax=Paramecium sonneborni TaxID=65129 RepID=A0A8S1P409_9CILI|nr:unnamed protein product [Paramecium sonneborni]
MQNFNNVIDYLKGEVLIEKRNGKRKDKNIKLRQLN